MLHLPEELIATVQADIVDARAALAREEALVEAKRRAEALATDIVAASGTSISDAQAALAAAQAQRANTAHVLAVRRRQAALLQAALADVLHAVADSEAVAGGRAVQADEDEDGEEETMGDAAPALALPTADNVQHVPHVST